MATDDILDKLETVITIGAFFGYAAYGDKKASKEIKKLTKEVKKLRKELEKEKEKETKEDE